MDFIFVSTGDWDHPQWTNKQHVAVALAAMGHRVLYAESIGLRRPFAVQRDRQRIFRRLGKWLSGLRQVQENVWVFTPVSIPLQRFTLVRRLNLFLLRLLLSHHSKALNFKNPVFWTYNPLTHAMIGTFGDVASVYHCVDEIKVQPGMPTAAIELGEAELLKKVDLVFTTSNALQASRCLLHADTHYFPNVADFDHFNRACTEEFPRPFEFEALQGPIIGFIGAVSGYKLDFSLLEQLAISRPGYHLVLIGDAGEGDPLSSPDRFAIFPNVHFIGPRSYQRLPQYLQHVDVCIIPSAINEYTRSMFPMKFFEYLAAGKPVVAVDTGTLTEYAEVCCLCATPKEFIRAIDGCLEQSDLLRRERGFQLARKNTYMNRTTAMVELVRQKVLANKK